MSPYVTLLVGAALFGAILGSFLNALSFRFNTGISILRGRSRCMRCGHALAWYDLIPLLSYALVGGKCRYCSSRISFQYPLVEGMAALLSLGVYLLHPEPLPYGLHLLIWMTVLFIVVYDLRHQIIPWSCSFLLAFLCAASLFVSASGFGDPAALSLAAGPLLALPLFLLSLLSMGRWMGWGDSLFELSLGWLVGLTQGLTALMLAVWIGAATGLLLIAHARLTPTAASLKSARGFTMKSEIPFAPFLALGAALAYFFHVDFFSTLPLLW